MIIVMKDDVTPESKAVARVQEVAASVPGVSCFVAQVQGVTRSLTEIHLLGSTSVVPTALFEQVPGVEKVIRVREKFRAIGRHGQADAFGFEYNGLTFSQDSFHVFAGLCAVDNRQNVERMFRALNELGVSTTRAGVYKPRTSPYDFQGHGSECLPYVFELAGKYGIRAIAMEVTRESHVDEISRALEASGGATGVVLQIGTRNAQNFELLRHVGQQTLPVLYKRGMGITLDESLNACEYIASGGNSRIIFCLRGVKTHLGTPHRNFVDFSHVPVLRRLTRLPVCVDPSHSVGKIDKAPDGLYDIHHATAQGIIAGANMVLVDFHPEPEKALCDGLQALLLEELKHFLDDTQLVRSTYEQRAKLASEAMKEGGLRV